jgi:pimeloyl-ACP methyl ester carboxylesterase
MFDLGTRITRRETRISPRKIKNIRDILGVVRVIRGKSISIRIIRRRSVSLENVRFHGKPPFRVAVLHGGPGAPGEMAPVARELARGRGVLEPLQTADTLDGQVQELRDVLETCADLPITLIGWSWGAWLGYILAARYPPLVRKLILVGCPPFEDRYVAQIQSTRLSRLTKDQRRELEEITSALDQSSTRDSNTLLDRFGKIMTKADSFNPLPGNAEEIPIQFDINQRVWGFAAVMRSSGELRELGKNIRCPVVAIHGDYDPHPAEGVQKPLETILKDFRFILLPHCGHAPWREKEARGLFFGYLLSEIE